MFNETNISRMIKAKNLTKSCPFSVCSSQITEIRTFLGLYFCISSAIISHFHFSMGRITSLPASLCYFIALRHRFVLHPFELPCLGLPGAMRALQIVSSKLSCAGSLIHRKKRCEGKKSAKNSEQKPSESGPC